MTTEQIEYRPIPNKFNHDIYTGWLLARQGDVALYAKTQSHGKGCRWEYEVVIVRKQPARLCFGTPQPAKERLPSDEEFGRYGWHTPTWERAWKMFEREIAKRPITMRVTRVDLASFQNSVEAPLFDSQRRPAGTMRKREPRALESIPVCELVQAIT